MTSPVFVWRPNVAREVFYRVVLERIKMGLDV